MAIGRTSRIRFFLMLLLCGMATAQSSHRMWTTEDGLPQNSVHAILQTRDGFVWIGTEKGLARFDGFDFVNYTRENSPELTDDDVRSLSEDSHGALLLSSAEKSFRLERGHFLPVTDIPKPNPKQLHDAKGIVWSYEGDEVTRRMPQGDVVQWKVSAKGDVNRVQAILLDARNVMWVGTRRGLFRIDRDKLTPINELSGDSILSLLEDREGSLWAGSNSTGLHLLSPRNIHTVSAFSNRGITTVAESTDGDLWAGTPDEGLLHLYKNKLQSLTSIHGLNSDFVLSLAATSGGKLLVGSPDGLNSVAEGRVVSSLRSGEGLPDDFIRSILPDRDGSIWIGTRRGLVHWERGKIAVLDHSNGLPSDLVGCLLRTRNGDLWIGTLHGVSRLRSGQLSNFTPDEAITSLVEDRQGRLWLGGTSGLYLWDGTALRRVAAAAVPQKIFGLLDDSQGFLWLRTHIGLGRIVLEQAAGCALRNTCDLAVRVFNTSDGLPSNDIFELGHPGQTRGKDGTLYFATRRGLVMINPATIQTNKVAPLPVVTHLTVDSRDRSIEAGDEITLEPTDRRVTFVYVAPSFRQPGEVRYRYRLEGFDRDWVDAGTNRSVSYTNLPSGHHRFVLMAQNEDGVWSANPAELLIFVRPPIYRRWWFYLLGILAGLAVFLSFYWLRERKLRHQFAAVLSERSRIAREIHDTLAQDLAGVSVQLEVVSNLMKGHQSEAAVTQLEEVKAVVRDGLRNARQSIWDLRATAEEQTLPVRAKRAVEQVAGPAQSVRFEITGAYRAFAPRIEEELISIIKEAVRNTARHSGSDHVVVSLQYRTDALVLSVRDYGRGFDPHASAAAGHFGLQGMRERAKAIGATFTLESAHGEGTCVTLISTYR